MFFLHWEKLYRKGVGRHFAGKSCGVLKDDLETNIPIALEAKH